MWKERNFHRGAHRYRRCLTIPNLQAVQLFSFILPYSRVFFINININLRLHRRWTVICYNWIRNYVRLNKIVLGEIVFHLKGVNNRDLECSGRQTNCLPIIKPLAFYFKTHSRHKLMRRRPRLPMSIIAIEHKHMMHLASLPRVSALND